MFILIQIGLSIVTVSLLLSRCMWMIRTQPTVYHYRIYSWVSFLLTTASLLVTCHSHAAGNTNVNCDWLLLEPNMCRCLPDNLPPSHHQTRKKYFSISQKREGIWLFCHLKKQWTMNEYEYWMSSLTNITSSCFSGKTYLLLCAWTRCAHLRSSTSKLSISPWATLLEVLAHQCYQSVFQRWVLENFFSWIVVFCKRTCLAVKDHS